MEAQKVEKLFVPLLYGREHISCPYTVAYLRETRPGQCIKNSGLVLLLRSGDKVLNNSYKSTVIVS